MNYYSVDDINYVGNELYKMNNFYSQDLDKRDPTGKVQSGADRIKQYERDLNVLNRLSHYNVSPIYKNIINNYRNSIIAERNKLTA